MKNNKAFTLIEILVVVLIIGILAAIAVPKYQRAVDKSKYSSMINMARGFADAEERFYLANGRYTTDWDELDLALPDKENLPTMAGEGNRLFIDAFGFKLDPGDFMSAIYFDGNYRVASYTIYYRNGARKNLDVRCVTYAARKKRGEAICTGIGGTLVSQNKNCGDTGRATICNQYKLYKW